MTSSTKITFDFLKIA